MDGGAPAAADFSGGGNASGASAPPPSALGALVRNATCCASAAVRVVCALDDHIAARTDEVTLRLAPAALKLALAPWPHIDVEAFASLLTGGAWPDDSVRAFMVALPPREAGTQRGDGAAAASSAVSAMEMAPPA